MRKRSHLLKFIVLILEMSAIESIKVTEYNVGLILSATPLRAGRPKLTN